jgi:hypothetical protein
MSGSMRFGASRSFSNGSTDLGRLVRGTESFFYDSGASMDWSDILYFIDQAVRREKMPTRQALEALENLRRQIDDRAGALRKEMESRKLEKALSRTVSR